MDENKGKILAGIDIFSIPRMKLAKKNFIERVFTKDEITNSTIEGLAKIFSVKEAFFKCIGIEPKWKEIEVSNCDQKSFGGDKSPVIEIRPALEEEFGLKGCGIEISISSDGKNVISSVIIIRN